MIRTSVQRDQKPGRWFVLSLFLHLIIIFSLTHTDLFRGRLHEIPSYYVDIVSLPELEPAPAATTQAPQPAPAPIPPTTPTPPRQPAMTLPAKGAAAPKQMPPQKAAPAATRTEEDARDFASRMSRLEYNAEARHQAAAVEALQKKAAATRQGPLAATGVNTGSDYAAYIQSRLKDALVTTMVYRSRSPEATVHIYIDKRGKLLRYVMEKPSSDKLFNDSVIRTIEKAKATFPPTPGGTDFDKLYVFSPQEVNKR